MTSKAGKQIMLFQESRWPQALQEQAHIAPRGLMAHLHGATCATGMELCTGTANVTGPPGEDWALDWCFSSLLRGKVLARPHLGRDPWQLAGRLLLMGFAVGLEILKVSSELSRSENTASCST